MTATSDVTDFRPRVTARAKSATRKSLAAPQRSRDRYHGDPNFMDSLARGLAVVRAFTEHRRCLTISQISQKTEIPRAAVRRCLYTLEKLGYVTSSDHVFALRPQIMNLGVRVPGFNATCRTGATLSGTHQPRSA